MEKFPLKGTSMSLSNPAYNGSPLTSYRSVDAKVCKNFLIDFFILKNHFLCFCSSGWV